MTRLSGKLKKVTFDLRKFNKKRMVKYQKTEKVAERRNIAGFSEKHRKREAKNVKYCRANAKI